MSEMRFPLSDARSVCIEWRKNNRGKGLRYHIKVATNTILDKKNWDLQEISVVEDELDNLIDGLTRVRDLMVLK